MTDTFNPSVYKQDGETSFEHELRLCLSKLRNEIKLDWSEIVDVLGLDVHYDHLRKKSYGYLEYDNYIKSIDAVALTILSISDLHVPYQLPIETFKEFRNRVDVLQINGDVLDMQSISKFNKIYRISPMEEIVVGREYLIALIDYINPKKVVVTYGNHDIRFESYLSKNLDSDLIELMPSTPLSLIFMDGFKHYNKRNGSDVWYRPINELFPDIDINYTNDWKCKIGNVWFCHPSASSSGILKTTEKAMDFFHKTDKEVFSGIVMAHTHRLAQAKIGFINLYEQGACCDVSKMTYGDGKLFAPQKSGFIVVCLDNNGDIVETKTRLISLN